MHTPRTRALRPARIPFLPLLLLGALGTGCSEIEDLFDGDDGPGSFQLVSGASATVGTSVLRQRGRWLVYQASEATQGVNGTDFNQDGDLQDLVPVVVDVQGLSQQRIDVAAEDFEILGDEIFLAVDEEEDSRDWNVDGMTDDLVVLHYSPLSGQLLYVDDLDQNADPRFVVTSSRVYYTTAQPLALVPETSVRYVDEAAPTAPVTVLNGDFGNTVSPVLLGADEDLVFVLQDEQLEVRDLNGDGDANDRFVLGLIDATDAAAPLRSTGLAAPGANPPVRALARGAGDWLVAFLVSESAQGANFNDPGLFDPAWQPTQCAGLSDSDTSDDVLFYVDFAAFASDPIGNPPTNTGLVGAEVVVAVPGLGGSPGHVGTLSVEFDDESCSLNEDGDANDAVVRITEATTPVLPIVDSTSILATSTILPGDTFGLMELEGRIVCVVNEAADGRDYDNKTGQNNDLLGWIDPNDGLGATWTFDHSTGAGEFFAGMSWLRPSADGSVLLGALEESVLGQPLNAGDADTNDSVPVVINFDPDENDELVFVGPAIACDEDDAGISLAGEHFIYKVDEFADSRDWDLDEDNLDIVFLRTRISNPLDSAYIGRLLQFNTSQNQGQLGPDDDPVVTTDGQFGGGFLINEGVDKIDLNGDADIKDRILRFFRF